MNTAKAVIIMRIPQVLLDALDKCATINDCSREDALREAVANYTNTPYTYTHPNAKYNTPEERKAANVTQSRKRMRAMRERKRIQKGTLDSTNTLAGWTDIIMGDKT